jgi:hypothetical protein
MRTTAWLDTTIYPTFRYTTLPTSSSSPSTTINILPQIVEFCSISNDTSQEEVEALLKETEICFLHFHFQTNIQATYALLSLLELNPPNTYHLFLGASHILTDLQGIAHLLKGFPPVLMPSFVPFLLNSLISFSLIKKAGGMPSQEELICSVA